MKKSSKWSIIEKQKQEYKFKRNDIYHKRKVENEV